MPVIEVLISPRGEIQIETHGFTGAACQEATRGFEAALGLVQSEQLTPAYYQTSPQEIPLALGPDAAD